MGKLGDFVVKRRWWIVGVWVIATVAIVSFAPSLASIQSENQSSFLPKNYESVQAGEVAQKISTRSENPTDIIVFTAKSGGELTDADFATIGGVVTQLNDKHLSQVQAVITSPEQIAPSKKAQLATVVYSGNANDQATIDAVANVRSSLDTLTANTNVSAGVTGGQAISYDTQSSSKRAESIVSIVTILLVVLLPALIFRSPLAGLLPLLAVGIVYSLSNALIAIAGHVFNFHISSQLSILFTVVLFGIGTDYILFLLFRYRERLRSGDHTRQAVAFSLSRAGEAIFSAALVVLSSFAALFFAKFGIFSSLAPGLVICVVVMMVAAMTLVPALVAIIGEKVFWPSKAWMNKPPRAAVTGKLGNIVAKWPHIVAGGITLILVLFALFSLGFKADFSTFSQPPKNTQSADAYNKLVTAFPAGVLNPTQVYVVSNTELDATQLAAVQAKLAAADGVQSAFPAASATSGSQKIYQFTVILKDDPYSAAALNTVAGPIRDAAHSFNSDTVQAYVGGVTSSFVDVQSVTNRDLRVIFPIAAVFIFIILAILLRSLVAPVILLICVSLGYAATLGITVLIFQKGFGDPGLISFIPLFMYIFVVAIGTDYNILTITRLREEVKEGNAPRKAAALTIEHSSSTVFAGGLILAATFASLLLGGISFLAQMGASISIGVALAAFVIAPFLIPSLAATVGYKIWWPGHRPKADKKA